MSFDFSVALIVPKAYQAKADRIACAMGFDELPGTTFSVPFTSDGVTITHYGCLTWANEDFIQILDAFAQGQTPIPETTWTAYGIGLTAVKDTLAHMIIGPLETTDPNGNLDAVLAANGLARYEEPA